MRSMKRVSKEEFNKFIKNYPNELETNFFMDNLSYYDFSSNIISNSTTESGLEELYSHIVAQDYYGWNGHEYYIIESENKE